MAMHILQQTFISLDSCQFLFYNEQREKNNNIGHHLFCWHRVI